MICEQALRMLRGEESEIFSDGTWLNSHPKLINVRAKYQSKPKPKKELVVPWFTLKVDIKKVAVSADGHVNGYIDDDAYYQLDGINLDLTDIDLPVTVKRPEVK